MQIPHLCLFCGDQSHRFSSLLLWGPVSPWAMALSAQGLPWSSYHWQQGEMSQTTHGLGAVLSRPLGGHGPRGEQRRGAELL